MNIEQKQINVQATSFPPEKGYEDIYSAEPYYDVENENKRALIHLMYVPPFLRGQGKGKEMLRKLVSELPPNIEYLRLKAVPLGSGCSIRFWESLGFSKAYANGNADEEDRILHLGVNGFACPPVQVLSEGEERHYVFD